MSNKLLRGTFLLTGATFISKFLGMIYVFPFFALIGTMGGALYSYAYTPYSILLSMATLGVPMAVSKFVSKYNTLGDYRSGFRMFKSGLLLMTISGVLAFAALYFLAPVIAPLVLGKNEHGNSIEDVTYVIRMISVALVIVPSMSIMRGFFQGNQSMEPTAVSQVIEQIVRIVFILAGTWFIIKVAEGQIRTAVGFSTFAAFIGAIGGLIVLLYYWKKYGSKYLQLAKSQTEVKTELTLKEMYLELLSYAGPFVFVSLAIPLYQLVDMFTFNRAMVIADKGKIAEDAYAMLTFSNHKLIMIPVSLATAFALTLVPAITESFTEKNQRALHKQIDQTLQIVVFLVLPAVVGLSVLAYPAYAGFFDVNHVELGGYILRWYAPIALLFSFFTVTAAILQGINRQKFAVYSLFAGLILKVALNIPLIIKLEAIGAIIATAIGYCLTIGINFYIIKKYTSFKYRVFFKRSLLIVIFATIMGIITQGCLFLISFIFDYHAGRIQSFALILVVAAIGGFVYLWLGKKSTLLKLIIGRRKQVQRNEE